MTRSRRHSARLLTAILVAVLVAGACGGSDGTEAGDEAGVSTTTTTTAAGSGTTDDASATPSGVEGTTGTSLAAGTGTPTPPEGGSLDAPARRGDIPLHGRYTYETKVDTVQSEEFLDVIDAGYGDGFIRQLQIRGTNDDATSQAVVWLGDLFYAEAEQRARGGSKTAVCAWDPGLTLLKLPIEVGAKWSVESTCADDPGDPVRKRKLDVEVTARETLEVGGKPIDVFVVKQTNRSSVDDDSPPIHVVETRTTTDKIWVERNLLVHSKGTLDSTLAGVPKGHDTFEKTLVSLEPEVGEAGS